MPIPDCKGSKIYTVMQLGLCFDGCGLFDLLVIPTFSRFGEVGKGTSELMTPGVASAMETIRRLQPRREHGNPPREERVFEAVAYLAELLFFPEDVTRDQ